MIAVSVTEPKDEVLSWLRKNQEKHEIILRDKAEFSHRLTDLRFQPMPEELIAATNRFPNYHIIKTFTEDGLVGKRRKLDGDLSVHDLPTDLGGETLEKGLRRMNQTIEHMTDSSTFVREGNFEALYAQYSENGYVFLRGILERNDIMNARNAIMQTLLKLDVMDEAGLCKSRSGWTIDTKNGDLIQGKSDFSEETGLEDVWLKTCSSACITSIKSNPALKRALTLLSKGKSKAEKCSFEPFTLAPNFAWLRVKAKGEFTPIHADVFYYRNFVPEMFANPEEEPQSVSETFCVVCGDGKDEQLTLICDDCGDCYHSYCLKPKLKVLPGEYDSWYCPACKVRPIFGTCWIPLGDCPVDHGVLGVLPKSTDLPDYYKTHSDKNGQLPASYSKHTKGLTWHSGNYYCLLYLRLNLERQS